MQKVLLLSQLSEAMPMMDPTVMGYLWQGSTSPFESFDEFYLLGFDWYDTADMSGDDPRVLIYLDREDLFFFCEDDDLLKMVEKTLKTGLSNEDALYRFFIALMKNDMESLNQFEERITDGENGAMTIGSRADYMARIVEYRRELLRRKRYYDQLVTIFENLVEDEEKRFSAEARRHFDILSARADRFCRTVLNLREYVTQMREAYQAQIDIEQNQLMKLFTLIAAIFLPLTLLVGWYGMNFKYMPELGWRYGYLGVVGLSVAICVVLIIIFKKKRWF